MKGSCPVAIATMLLAVGCGSAAAQLESNPTTSSPNQEADATIPSDEVDDASSIEIVVVLPNDWPNPLYPGWPEVVVDGIDGAELRILADGDRITVRLPSSGDYSVGAIVEDGGCYDTAGVAQSGNPPVAVADGDVVELQDTGEICD